MNICMVPVRKGSERLAKKNYLKIGHSTILEIALNKAIKSKAFDRIFINSDDPNLEEVASRLGVNFYLIGLFKKYFKFLFWHSKSRHTKTNLHFDLKIRNFLILLFCI